MSVARKTSAFRPLRRSRDGSTGSLLSGTRRSSIGARLAGLWTSAHRLVSGHRTLLLVVFPLAVVAVCLPFDRLVAAAADIRSPWLVLAAAALYGLAHVSRAIRLAVLCAPALSVSARTVLLLHFHAAPVSFIAPFKLGELYRWQQLTSLSRDPVGAIVTIVLERMLDAIVLIACFGIFVWAGGATLPDAEPLTVVLIAATGIGLFAVMVAPQCLKALQRYILTYHSQPRARKVLRFIDSARLVTESANARLISNLALLLTLSGIVWLLESSVLLLLAKQLDQHGTVSLTSFLAMTLTPRAAADGASAVVALYALVCLATLMVAWPVATALYLRRLKLPRRTVGTTQRRLAFSPARRLHISATRIKL